MITFVSMLIWDTGNLDSLDKTATLKFGKDETKLAKVADQWSATQYLWYV